jgi:hypothetical protein
MAACMLRYGDVSLAVLHNETSLASGKRCVPGTATFLAPFEWVYQNGTLTVAL